MNTFLAKLLNYFNLTEDEYNYMSRPIDQIVLKDPNKIDGMDKVVLRIKKAIENKEKIIVYGDYDCDGITATSIIVKTFEKLNYPIASYIPSRYLDGYGLNVENVLKIHKADYKLIICVDNGISAHDAINKANELGVDVLVVDHHEIPEEQVKAVGIIHPIVSHISDIVGSGGYMSLFVSAALLGYYDDYLVTLAGLSVISDLMELKDYNRDVVRLALNNFQQKGYISLRLLLDSPIITEKSFALDIAPKINAIGRMIEDTSVNKLVKYLTTENRDELYSLRDWIIENNEKRKLLTKEAVECLPIVKDQKGICILTNMKEGLIGLIVNRLLNEYNVPSIVFTQENKNPDIIKGSIRSKEGFNVMKAFDSLKKYIIEGGGHAFAGGLSIKKSDFEAFKKDFIELCSKYPIQEEKTDSIDIELKDFNSESYEILRTFAPFGMGFKEPAFLIRGIPTQRLTFISQGKHLSHKLALKSKLLGFNMNEGEIKANRYINIYGSFGISSFKGMDTLEFRINKYEKDE